MKKKRYYIEADDQRGFGIIGVLLIILVAGVIGTAGYIYFHQRTAKPVTPRAATSATAAVPRTTTFAAVPAGLRDAIVAQTAKDAPACVKAGHLVMADGSVDNPRVDYDASGFAAAGIGCDDGAWGIFARVGGTWRFLAATQFYFSCDLLERYRFPHALLALNAPGSVQCFDGANKPRPYNG